MSKQDRQGVRTPADIERKYNLGQLNAASGGRQDILLSQLTQTLNQFMATTNARLEEVDEVNKGYFNTDSEAFYKEYKDGNFSGAIKPESGKLYIDLLTNTLYHYTDSSYIAFSGGSVNVDYITDEEYESIMKEVGI